MRPHLACLRTMRYLVLMEDVFGDNRTHRAHCPLLFGTLWTCLRETVVIRMTSQSPSVYRDYTSSGGQATNIGCIIIIIFVLFQIPLYNSRIVTHPAGTISVSRFTSHRRPRGKKEPSRQRLRGELTVPLQRTALRLKELLGRVVTCV